MPVCIAGMHRSGTSMITRILNLSGLHLGSEAEILGPVDYNEEGLWENGAIQRFNDLLLEHLGGGWDLVPDLSENWECQPSLDFLYQQARSILQSQSFEDHAWWGWKDPRSSIVLPFWQNLVKDLKTVICVRHPVEVAKSLTKRGYSSPQFGLKLWFDYNCLVLASTRPENRVITHYESYFHNPHAEVRRILLALGQDVSDEVIEGACSAVFTSLRHSRNSQAQTEPLSSEIRELYRELCDQAGLVFQESQISLSSRKEPNSGKKTRYQQMLESQVKTETIHQPSPVHQNQEFSNNGPNEIAAYRQDFFKRLNWESDRLNLDKLVFRLQHFRDDSTWELGAECFIFFKVKVLVDEYAHFFINRTDFNPQNIMEIGIWEGGSIPFWFELFQPRKHVGIDIAEREDSPYFKKYLSERNLEEKIRIYWGTDQADASRLREIVAAEFEGPLDLVIDDASHMYGLTKASFNTLFPLLRAGGLYIIEDWAWEHWPGFSDPDWPKFERLGRLINELIQTTGSTRGLITNLVVSRGFVAIERGPLEAKELEPFDLERFIYHQPDIPSPDLVVQCSLLEQDRQELMQYLGKVEKDRHIKIEQLTRVERNLKALELTRSVRLSRWLSSLIAKVKNR